MKHALFLSFAVTVLCLPGCKKDTTSSNVSKSSVMFVNAISAGSRSVPLGGNNNNTLVTPGAGSAKVRFANFCSAATKLNCYFRSQKIDSFVTYKAVDEFISIPAGTDNLMVQDNSNHNYTATIQNQTFAGGKLYTVMFTDTADGQSGFKLTVINTY
jgi:hypothetical protein